ncbi:MAG: hypothetical protein E6R07_12980 [Nevskiaceae bacterium]|nr:MAG: hypothetical protein E6R07_12980 [Nevskiaceae bacterium]
MSQSARLLLIVLLAAAAGTALIGNGRWLIAHAYTRFAEDQARWPETRAAAAKAADYAIAFQPYSAQAYRQRGLNRLLLRQHDEALADYQAAISRAPADAFLWRDYALALLYADRFDERLKHAVSQAQTWGRRSAPIHFSLAVAGLKVFADSDPELQQLWLKSIRLAYQVQPGALMQAAYTADQEILLCQQVIPDAGRNVWCAIARWRHGLCTSASDCIGPSP